MKRSLPEILTLLLLVTLAFVTPGLAQTLDPNNDETPEVDDAPPVSRVARLSFVQGDVSFLRAGVTEWAPVVENLPLLAGDQLYAGRAARAEVQLGRGDYIRLSENTALTITRFSDSEAQFEITEGTAIIRIERLSSAFHRFEVDTPNTAVVLHQDGVYRVDVRGENDSELVVKRGEAEASTDEGSFRVREGHRLVIDTSTGGKLELVAYTTQDDSDQWSDDRDTTIDRVGASLAPDYVASYETTYNDFYGASDLSSYGTWTTYPSYGQCWIPRVGSDWTPYRQGQWLWIPSAGWTWLSSEPWGWAPYHYGRWAYLPGIGWAWIPGIGSPYGGYGYRDYRWLPALVFFFDCLTPRGDYVGWYPLAPGEHWHRPDRDRRGDTRGHAHHPSPRDGSPMPVDGGGRVLPPGRRGMTILPIEGFVRGGASVRPAAPDADLSRLISKGAQSGLPQIKPTQEVIAPALGENDRRSPRRIAVPPTEVVKRPVVTSNPNVDASAQLGAPRERRLIAPRERGTTTPTPVLVEPGIDRGAQRRSNSLPQMGGSQSDSNSGERPSPKVQRTLPGEPSTAAPPASDENANGAARQKRRAQPEPTTTVVPQEPGSRANKQKANDAPSREQRPSTSDSKSNEPARPRDNGASAQRNEAKQGHSSSETREPARQEQPAQKEQPKEQQQEHHKKP
jgi:hypothetical protein